MEITDACYKKNYDFIKNYIKNRFSKSLKVLGFKTVPEEFNSDELILSKTKWFDIEILSTSEKDFFAKRSTDYNKKSQNFSPSSLF